MAKRSVRTELGRLSIVAAEERFVAPAAALALEIARRAQPTGELCTLDGVRVYCKGSALYGKARVRYALKRFVLLRALPRVREFANLRWLRHRLFQAPRPIAAGVLWRAGLPAYQFLATQEIAGAVDLARFLDESGDGALRGAVLDEIAREVARMHALGFVHHDLFLRNVLVVAARPHSRVWFVDAWAGGPRPNLRGPEYDVQGFARDARERLTDAEIERWRAAYGAERAALALPRLCRRI